MTQRQAWALVLRIFMAKRSPLRPIPFRSWAGDRYVRDNGMCGVVHNLKNESAISLKMANAMILKIERERRRGGTWRAYLFSPRALAPRIALLKKWAGVK